MSRYLWAVGERAAAYQPGDILVDRYLCQGLRIFLDTKPAILPGNLDEVPEPFIPYLKLSPHQLHIPQIHDWVQPDDAAAKFSLLLLDQAPLYVPETLAERGIVVPSATAAVQILPMLDEMWQTATPLRQLHWLWQVGTLWQSMQAEGVVSSLLTSELLRVEGSIVRLLELRWDSSSSMSLAVLGEFWSNLAETARPEVQAPLQQLCQEMQRGSIRNAEEVVSHLDGSIADLGRSQQSRQIEIATLSDKGPSRQRNEDACYPVSSTVAKSPPAAPLVIVCDGIGGHQGGDVASNLAIKSLEQQLKTLQPDRLNPVTLEVELEKAVGIANDLISQQNDNEQRFDRQRMGTTVVMALIRAHELYMTHVGDSRAYWITRWGCHQITQDDDVASREVRLGYSSYPQALQQPSSGSLVQALGMGSANNLYPTVQRFILDEDCVFLICSDGLSDNDQVETHWEKVILPLLDSRTDLGTVSRQWVDIANHYNGYDNTTVGLIHCKIVGANPAIMPTVSSSATQVELPPTRPPGQTTRLDSDVTAFQPDLSLSTLPTTIPTQRFDRPKPSRQPSSLPLLTAIVALGLLAAAILLGVKWFNSLQPGIAEAPANSPRSSPLPPAQTVPGTGAFIPLDRLQVREEIAVASDPQRYDQGLLDRRLQPGSVVESTQKEIDGKTWVQLEVCAASAAELATPDEFSASPGGLPSPDTSSPAALPNPEGLPNIEPNIEKDTTASTVSKNLSAGQAGWISREQYQSARNSGSLEKISSIGASPDAPGSLDARCANLTNPEDSPTDPIDPPSPSVLQSPPAP